MNDIEREALSVQALCIASVHHFHLARDAKQRDDMEGWRDQLTRAATFGEAASAAGCEAHPGKEARALLDAE